MVTVFWEAGREVWAGKTGGFVKRVRLLLYIQSALFLSYSSLLDRERSSGQVFYPPVLSVVIYRFRLGCH
jgi:hypothetical protein